MLNFNCKNVNKMLFCTQTIPCDKGEFLLYLKLVVNEKMNTVKSHCNIFKNKNAASAISLFDILK